MTRPSCELDTAHASSLFQTVRVRSYSDVPSAGPRISTTEAYERENAPARSLVPKVHGGTCDTVVFDVGALGLDDLVLAGASLTTGEVRWTRSVPLARCFLHTLPARVYCEHDGLTIYDADSGEELRRLNEVIAIDPTTGGVLRRTGEGIEYLDADGDPAWTASLPERPVLGGSIAHGAALVSVDTPEDAEIVAFDLESGEVLFDGFVYDTPPSYRIELVGDAVVAQSGVSDLVIAARDGSELGRFPVDGHNWLVPDPARLIFLTADDDGLVVGAVEAGTFGAPAWQTPLPVDSARFTWQVADLILLEHAGVPEPRQVAISTTTGEIAWRSLSLEPIAHDGELIFVRQGFRLTAHSLADGESVWGLDPSQLLDHYTPRFELAGDHLVAVMPGEIVVLVP